MEEEIYLDNAASTRIHPDVFQAMLPYLKNHYANSSSPHHKGSQSKQALNQARQSIADYFQCQEDEVIFCSSATEANNLAILGTCQPGDTIVTTNIEHSSVSKPLQHLEKQGSKIIKLKANKQGFISIQDLKESLKQKPKLVSIIYANHEIGSIQNIQEISEICAANNTTFHTDACQAINQTQINLKKTPITLLTINGSKIYAPKGIGILINKSLNLSPITFGGQQEFGFKPGTENITNIVAISKALTINKENHKTKTLRNLLAKLLVQQNPEIIINGPDLNSPQRLDNNLNIQIPKIPSQKLIQELSKQKIYLSATSACQSHSNLSTTLQAIGLTKAQAASSIRISLGIFNTEKQIITAATKISNTIKKIKASQFLSLS